LRIVLVLDHLAGHLSYDLVRWFCDHGVMPLYTPVGGSWPAHWPSRSSPYDQGLAGFIPAQ
jgi:hypothetical protein